MDEARLRPSGRLPAGFILFAVVAFVILCALGFWQLQRHEEKQLHNARLASQQNEAARALPPSPQWDGLDREAWEHRKVRLQGVFDRSREVYWFNHRKELGPGYDIFTPLRLRDGGWVVVDRGFIAALSPPPRSAPATAAAETAFTGFLRLPAVRRWFDPKDDAAARLWVVRDLAAMAAWMEVAPVAPWFLHAETPLPLAGDPAGGPVAPAVGPVASRVDHVAYALTWFAMAAILVGVTIAYSWQQKARRRA